MLGINELMQIGIQVNNEDSAMLLTANSAFEWLSDHTTLTIDMSDLETLKALPSAAKLFVVKYCDIMGMSTGVTSESIGPLTHSFGTNSKSDLIWQYARELLSGHLKSQVKVFTAKRKWS